MKGIQQQLFEGVTFLLLLSQYETLAFTPIHSESSVLLHSQQGARSSTATTTKLFMDLDTSSSLLLSTASATGGIELPQSLESAGNFLSGLATTTTKQCFPLLC